MLLKLTELVMSFQLLKVREDVTSIILNLKDLVLTIDDDVDVTKKLEIDFKGPGIVKGSDIKCPVTLK